MNDYERAISSLNNSSYPHKEIRDLRGDPFFIVEKKTPDKCPPQGAEEYYSWGCTFSADGNFMESWGAPPTGATGQAS